MYIQVTPKKSPTAITIASLGMQDIWGEVEHRKIMFWNKLCCSSVEYI